MIKKIIAFLLLITSIGKIYNDNTPDYNNKIIFTIDEDVFEENINVTIKFNDNNINHLIDNLNNREKKEFIYKNNMKINNNMAVGIFKNSFIYILLILIFL